MLRLVDAKRGRFLVFDNDQYVGRSLIELGEFAEFQAELFDLLLKPEAVVVEVGANVGAHTVVLAKRAAKVLAFEPQRRVFNVLCGNIALNNLDNVECFRAAGGETRGKTKIPTLDFDAPKNNFGAFDMDKSALYGTPEDEVDVIPINAPCDFMKIDVEGWEANVLRGSTPMIKDYRPVLYVENDRKEKSDELISLIQELGYKAYWHVTPLFRKENFHGVKEDPFGGVYSADLLCLPKEIGFTRLPEATVGHLPDVLH